MASVRVPHGETVRGGEIFAHHFGVNYLSVKDEAEGGGALPAYANAVNDLAGSGGITIRFPGGGVAEDKVNPDAYTVLDDGVVVPGTHKGPLLNHHVNGVFAGAIDPDDPLFERDRIVTLTGKAGDMTVHHSRLLHGSAPNVSDRPRFILFYEIAKADAWPILGAGSYFHALGQQKFWDDLQERTITGKPCVQPRLEQVPVVMPLPPAPDSSSIFRTQESAGARSAFA